MKKFLVLVLLICSSFLFSSCSSGATERNYIMGDAVHEKASRSTIVAQE